MNAAGFSTAPESSGGCTPDDVRHRHRRDAAKAIELASDPGADDARRAVLVRIQADDMWRAK